ncbi:unnamed protein product [Boreogadus saida]
MAPLQPQRKHPQYLRIKWESQGFVASILWSLGVPKGQRERPTDPCLTRHHHFVRLINLPGGAPCSVSQSRAARRAKERAQPPQPGPLQHDSVAKLYYVSHLSPPGGPPAPLAPT